MGTTLKQVEFVAYLGPPEIHDGVIRRVRRENANCEVEIRGADGSSISVHFCGVTEVQENRAEGMMLYAIAEYRRLGGPRLFVFANWESEDDATLSVAAKEVTFQVTHEDG